MPVGGGRGRRQPGYHLPVDDTGARQACAAAAALGLAATGVDSVEGDASRRMFYRLHGAAGTLIAAVYPSGADEQVARDVRIQRWGWSRQLPIPEPLGHAGLVTLSEDLGSVDLERALAERGEEVLGAALETLAAFQRCRWDDCPTPPFDAAFFRRELAGFEEQVVPAGHAGSGPIAAFLDGLAARLAGHPYRLAHRDFHVNNLFLRGGRVLAVDYQDMRGGPDTYDAVSLLRERAGGERLADDGAWRERAASILRWSPGWEVRYLECAAQRGLKVVGTFVRLAAAGKPGYLRFLPLVRRRAGEAAAALGAPDELLGLLRQRT